jgi:hypothetical protein
VVLVKEIKADGGQNLSIQPKEGRATIIAALQNSGNLIKTEVTPPTVNKNPVEHFRNPFN